MKFFNQQCHTYTDLSSEEMYGSGWKSTVHPDDIEQLESWWRGFVQSGEPAKTEARFRHFDGEYRWFQISAVPVRDEQGNVVSWRGINIDSSSIGRNITDAICQSIVVLAPDGTTLYANRVALEHTGLTVQEMNMMVSLRAPSILTTPTDSEPSGTRDFYAVPLSNTRCVGKRASSIAGTSFSTNR